MKLLFASDSFKGSLTGGRTAELLERAAHEVFGACETIGIPIADGGEGTAEAVIAAEAGRLKTVRVHGPLGEEKEAAYGLLDGGRAVIEMAAASGLPFVPPEKRDPMRTSSFGTGELIRDALAAGCREIAVAIGGSATNDGGMGCMRALGVRFLDENGTELEGAGRDLLHVADIDVSGLDPAVREAKITVMCDVRNPLCGENGATLTFGRQKGGTDETLAQLEAGMCRYRDLIRSRFGTDCDALEGAGAAGGLGAALAVFCGGTLRSGIETVLDLVRFDERLEGADLVVTGEGCTDRQSCFGKVMQGVGLRARKKGIPVLGLSGSLGRGAMDVLDFGISSLMTSVNAPMPLAEALERAEELYYEAAVRMFRFVKVGMELATSISSF